MSYYFPLEFWVLEFFLVVLRPFLDDHVVEGPTLEMASDQALNPDKARDQKPFLSFDEGFGVIALQPAQRTGLDPSLGHPLKGA
jgi:hypothetical protein